MRYSPRFNGLTNTEVFQRGVADVRIHLKCVRDSRWYFVTEFSG
jgi:hypothetical protein